MPDITFRHDDLETRRKRLRFRAWHRGTKEADLLIGPFADAELETMKHPELDDFEAVLRMPDPNLVTWLTGQEEAPEEVLTPVLLQMIAFQQKR